MSWQIKNIKKFQANQPIFIEGLPGIGNVGKVVIDFLIEEIKAKKIMELFSFSLPNSVFVNEKNLVDLPNIEIYHKKIGKKDFFFLTGDVQPVDERSSYEFAEKLLDVIQQYNCQEIITLGGIGLNEVPKHPKVYCTGNSRALISQFKKHGAKTNVYGVVGPIVGISGLLLGLSQRRKISAASLLAETFGHPMYLGLKGAKEILKVLTHQYNLNISLKDLDKEIREIEADMKSSSDPLSGKHKALSKIKKFTETSYIG